MVIRSSRGSRQRCVASAPTASPRRTPAESVDGVASTNTSHELKRGMTDDPFGTRIAAGSQALNVGRILRTHKMTYCGEPRSSASLARGSHALWW